jgi:acyl-CoA thioesterase-1
MVASVGTATGAAPIAEAELHEDVTNAFVNPQKTSKLPKVLIIGDSISIGYTAPVRKNLAGKADVSRPSMNCQHSGTGVQMVKAWMGTTKWDVIHFNFGIWDTHWVDAKGALVRSEADHPPSSGIHIRYTPEQYRENLTQIIKVLQGSGAKLIWASTTPVMYRKGERLKAIPTLNRTAEELMKANNIAINDLYGFIMPHVKEWQASDQAHFNAIGKQKLGQQVSESILQALKNKK